MNISRLLRMRPEEIRTRAVQGLSKRWARPPACRLEYPSGLAPILFDPPTPSPGLAAHAERVCGHRFDLLGYAGLDFGSPINWHFDPVHHKQAPRIPWYKIPFLDFDQVGDHKIIWELNRHQHLVTLAEAWRATQDDRFAREIRAQWLHWQQENPYPIGINWASSLEVAFRALSWLWVCQLLGEFSAEWLRAFHLHGWHIERYLSTYFSPNTHLLGEGVALFSIGLLCPHLPRARRWLERGWSIVLRQAEAQVLPDGFHFEQSLYYHVYALDFFRHTRDLAARNSIAIPPAFDAVIHRMSEALAALSQAGLPPRFGDDDGGRVIVPPLSAPAPTAPRSIALKSAGIYAMTSGESQLFIDAGPHGALSGGHSHADALSIQLITKGRPVLIDPGTFCYTCPARDRYRGTAAHNTVQLDGRDQARPAGPFAWNGMPQATLDVWFTGETYDVFAGHHNGYAPVTHQRWVFGLKNKFWLVRDVVTGPGRHRLDIYWHFLNERDVSILPPAGHNWSQTIERFDWSPVYGKQELAYVLRFSTETELPAEFAVVLIGTGRLTQNGPGAYRYEDADSAYDFSFPPAGGRGSAVCHVITAEGAREVLP